MKKANCLKGYNISILILLIAVNIVLSHSPDKTTVLQSPVNLSHALALVDSIKIDNNIIMFIRIYADAPDYKPVIAVGEGIACVDDVGRFMEVLETEIVVYHNKSLIPIAAGMTRFLLYLSRDDGLWYNFIFQDGQINKTHKNSVADFGWWAIRGLRGLAAAVNIFSDRPEYSSLYNQVKNRIMAADIHIKKILPAPNLMLLKNAPDVSSELLIALTKLHNTGEFDYGEPISILAGGIMERQYPVKGHDLYGMYYCWEDGWHNWGNNQAYGLLEAYEITGDDSVLPSVKAWADYFVPFLIDRDFPWEIIVESNGEYSLTENPQIAYGMNSLFQGMTSLAVLTGDEKYHQYAEKIFGWFEGQNKSGTRMYDPATGRCFDGINSKNSVNYNSGAESTIECLLAIQRRGGIY